MPPDFPGVFFKRKSPAGILIQEIITILSIESSHIFLAYSGHTFFQTFGKEYAF
jgi:hypothetical protein